MKNFIHRIFKRYMQPKTTFTKDKFMILCYERGYVDGEGIFVDGRLLSKRSRNLWHTSTLQEVREAFGEEWPGFTNIPSVRCYGRQNAVAMIGANGRSYLLYRIEWQE